MSKETALVIAVCAGCLATLFFAYAVGKGARRGESTEETTFRIRQDIAGIFSCLVITNGRLAAILAALIY